MALNMCQCVHKRTINAGICGDCLLRVTPRHYTASDVATMLEEGFVPDIPDEVTIYNSEDLTELVRTLILAFAAVDEIETRIEILAGDEGWESAISDEDIEEMYVRDAGGDFH